MSSAGRRRLHGRRSAAAARTSPSSSCRATSATRTSDQIATDLRRVLVGLPGVTITTRASGGNQQLTRAPRRRQPGQPAGGRNPRRRPRPRRERLAQDVLDVLQATRRASPTRRSAAKRAGPSWPSASIGPKAALLGLSVSGVANTIRTNISGTQAAIFRERGKEFPIIVRLREEDRDAVRVGQRRADQHAAGAWCSRPRTCSTSGRRPARRRSSARTSSGSPASTPSSTPVRALGDAVKAVQARLPQIRRPAGLLGRVRRRGRAAGAGVPAAAGAADSGRAAGLRGHGVPVRVAAGPLHRHVLGAGGRHRRGARP